MQVHKSKRSNRTGTARPRLSKDELWILRDALEEKVREFQREKCRSEHYFKMLRLRRKLRWNYVAL